MIEKENRLIYKTFPYAYLVLRKHSFRNVSAKTISLKLHIGDCFYVKKTISVRLATNLDDVSISGNSFGILLFKTLEFFVTLC